MKKLFIILTILLLLSGCSDSLQEVSSAPEDTEQSTAVETGNIFLDATVDYKPVSNGTNTSVIGKRASISVSKDAAVASTSDDFLAFAEEMVDGSTFNWWSIFFDDGTGITFTGSSISAPEYGKIAKDGTLSESYGFILLEDGIYTYQKLDE